MWKLLLTFLVSQVHADAREIIMPLGDVITSGAGDGNGNAVLSYRYFLWQDLIARGVDFDFVGTQTNEVPNDAVDAANGWVDCAIGNCTNFQMSRHHEAHKEWRADQGSWINLMLWLRKIETPTIALVHLGTNDCAHANSTVEGSVKGLRGIITTLWSTNPAMRIFLAQIIPRADRFQTEACSLFINELNSQIPILAAEMSSLASANRPRSSDGVLLQQDYGSIIVVDQFSGFDTTADTFDGTHPNTEGARKMANRWISALFPAPPNEDGSSIGALLGIFFCSVALVILMFAIYKRMKAKGASMSGGEEEYKVNPNAMFRQGGSR
jgi:mannan endo-1,4-beta-mannosidase